MTSSLNYPANICHVPMHKQYVAPEKSIWTLTAHLKMHCRHCINSENVEIAVIYFSSLHKHAFYLQHFTKYVSGATVHLKSSSKIFILYITPAGDNGNGNNRKFSKYQNSRPLFYQLHFPLDFLRAIFHLLIYLQHR